MNENELRGRVVLVAGGTGNVGRVIVDALLEAGANVAIPSRAAANLQRLRAEVGSGRDSRLVCLEGDIADPDDAPRLLADIASRVGPIDAAVASLGRFVSAPSVLAAPLSDLQRALDSYLIAHFVVARTVIPALRERGGSYTFINGMLASGPAFPGTGLVSIVTAAQGMLARVCMTEAADGPVRVNEVVVHTRFGWSGEDAAADPVSQRDVARYITLLASARGNAIRGRSIDLDSSEPLRELFPVAP